MIPLSDEKVSGKRALHFKVTSDLYTNDMAAVLMLIGNIVLIGLLSWLSNCLKRSNPVRKFINKEKMNMIFGHIVNLMIPLILPWTYVMLESGVRNVRTKINAVCCLFLYFLGLLFPIYYLFELLMDREKILIK